MRDLVVERIVSGFERQMFERLKQMNLPRFFGPRRCTVCGASVAGWASHCHTVKTPRADGIEVVVTCGSYYCQNTDPR